MLYKASLVLVLLCGLYSQGQLCPKISTPVNGDIDVAVDTEIRWPQVDGIFGYVVSLGTTPGGGEIINRRSSGTKNFYVPEVGLPENTKIYVTIRLFVLGQPVQTCQIEEFTTINVNTPPGCTTLSYPLNNATQANVNRPILWNYAPTATGYRLNIGTSSGATDVVNNLDIGNVLNFKPPTEFPLDQEYFVRIIPYNENGDAIGCQEESFITGIPTFDCDQVPNPATGTIYSLKPEIAFPDEIGFCQGEDSKTIRSDDSAQGFRWYKLHQDGTETLISESREVDLISLGRYRYEAYNNAAFLGNTVECANIKEFNVILSGPAVIDKISVSREADGLVIVTQVNGPGSYEFALDDENGPFQDSNTFTRVPIGEHSVFVREKNGCGMVSRIVERQLSAKDFPQFFTPNGDGIHDFWQFSPPSDVDTNIEIIQIYDRYGNFLSQVDPKRIGWDGSFMGRPLPASDYWFKATTFSQQEIYGHFALKR